MRTKKNWAPAALSRLQAMEKELGTVKSAAFSEGATLTIGDAVYTLRRESALRGKFLMEDEFGTVLLAAEKPSAWKDRFVFSFGDVEFELFKASTWRVGFALCWNGEQVGRVDRVGFFKRTADVDLPDSLPLEVRAFIFWLVLVMWNRYAASAAS